MWRMGSRGPISFPLLLFALVLDSPSATAQHQKQPADRPVTQADLAQLQAQLNEQRQLFLRILETERQHVEALMRLVSEGKAGAVSETAPARPPGALEPTRVPTVGPPKAPPAPPRGTVVGKVSLAGAESGSAVVYVTDVDDRAAGTHAEMKQIGKRFVPGTLVVTRGSRVSFPNLDPIFHNVFSLTPGNSFDLGNYRKGDAPKAVLMSNTGAVNVYCNMHSQMIGYILVVPNHLYAKTDQAGSFRISGVPTGRHKVAAWAPNADPVVHEVEVTSGASSSVEFTLAPKRAEPHMRKNGAPYGSYEE